MKKYKPTTSQRRAFVISLRETGLSYDQIAEQAIKQFGIQNLPKGYDKRQTWLDEKRELNKTTRNRLKTDIRRKRILEYRMAGMGFGQILQNLNAELGEKNLPRGYCERHVCRDLKRYLKKIDTENKQELRETKNLYRERLNCLLNIVWEKASRGDLQAIDRVLIITKLLSKLDGIVNVTPPIATPAEKNFTSLAEIGEYIFNLNGKAHGNGNNNE